MNSHKLPQGEAVSNQFVCLIILKKIIRRSIYSLPTFFSDSIPPFVVKILPNLKFTAYHAVNCVLDVIFRYQRNCQISEFQSLIFDQNSKKPSDIYITSPRHRKCYVMKETLFAMGEKMFGDDTIIVSIKYHSTSRSCYEKVR